MAISNRSDMAVLLRTSLLVVGFWLLALQPQVAQAQFISPPPKGNGCDPRFCHEFANCLADGGFGDISISPHTLKVGETLTITFSSQGGSNPSWPASLSGPPTGGRGGRFIRWQSETMCGGPGAYPVLTRVGTCTGNSCQYRLTSPGSFGEDDDLGGRPWAIVRLEFSTPGGLAWDEDYFGVIEEQDPPEALFTWDQSDTNPLTVNFDGSGSMDPDGEIETYLWDFGDGETSDEMQPSYTYKEYGTYQVMLTVTDDDDLMDTQMQQVKVKPPAEMTHTLTVEPDTSAIGEMVTLTLTVENTGEATLTDIAPTGEVIIESGDDGGAVELTGGPDPETIATLEAGQMATITWEYETTEAGAVSFSVDAVTGKDPDGETVEADPNTTCEIGKTSTVQACGAELEIDGPSLAVNSISDRAKDDERMGCDTGETITRDGEEEAECTLRAAIQAVNAGEFEAEDGGKLTITFDIPGATPTITVGDSLLVEKTVVIDGTSQEGYDAATGQPVVEVRGGNANGFVLKAEATEVRGLAIGSFTGAGIQVEAARVIIEKNYIGTDRTGMVAVGNETGVSIKEAPEVVVRENLISGNRQEGIEISRAMNTLVEGNRIGLNARGDNAIGVTGRGIKLFFAQDNIIRKNIIVVTQPSAIGLYIDGSNGNRIEGNVIGSNEDLTLPPLPNGLQDIQSILIEGGSNNMIGGSSPSARNHLLTPVFIANSGYVAVRNVVKGNYLGVNRDGTTALGRGFIVLFDTEETTIGGPTPTPGTGDGNIIVEGVILISATNGRIEGNLLGASQADGQPLEGMRCGDNDRGLINISDSEMTTIINNYVSRGCGHGVRIEFSDRMTYVADNDISWNKLNGISVESSYNSIPQLSYINPQISQNAIYSNGRLGIDVEGDGVTLNDDPFDVDGVTNYPVLYTVAATSEGIRIVGSVSTRPSLAGRTYTVEFFSNSVCDLGSGSAFTYGEGEYYLGSVQATSGLTGLAEFEFVANNLEVGHFYITATATDADGSTGEFSRCRPIAAEDLTAQTDFDTDTPGLAFDDNGVRVTITEPAAGKTTQTTATLYATRYDTPPDTSAFSGTSAVSNDGSVILPNGLLSRYYDLSATGLVDADGNPIQLTFDLCLDATNQTSSTGFEHLLVLQRTEETGGVWMPHDTRIEAEGSTRYACAEGLTQFGEFAFGVGGVAPLAAPSLLEPHDHTEDVEESVVLTWQGLSDAATYDVQLAVMPTFNQAVLDTNGLATATLSVEALQAETVYHWRVRGVTANGEVGPWSSSFAFGTTGATGVAVAEEGAVPEGYALLANYPNPFNPQTTIVFTLPQAAPVRLTVYDILGRQVAVLRDGVFAAGRHEATFDASGLPTGVYLYRLEAGTFVQTRRMLLVK